MEGLARAYGLKVDASVDERYDPERNIDTGTRFIRHLIDKYGNFWKVAAGYNMGETKLDKAEDMTKLPVEPDHYVAKVAARYKLWEELSGAVIEQPLYRSPDVHMVKRGDNLYSIARLYNLKPVQIEQANPQLKDPSLLHPDMALNIPKRSSS